MVRHLAICAPYSPTCHGPPRPGWEGREELAGGFLSLYTVTTEEFRDGFFAPLAADTSMELVEAVAPAGEYALVILKTHFLRLFQRKWKQRYKRLIEARSRPPALFSRNTYGKWVGAAAYI